MSAEHQVTELRCAITRIEEACNKFIETLGNDVASSGLGNDVLADLDALEEAIAEGASIS